MCTRYGLIGIDLRETLREKRAEPKNVRTHKLHVPKEVGMSKSQVNTEVIPLIVNTTSLITLH